MKNNILLALAGVICFHAGIINAMWKPVVIPANPQVALIKAIEERELSNVKLAIAHGAKGNVEDAYGRMPLDVAISKAIEELKLDASEEIIREWTEIIKMLIAAGADVNAKNAQGSTPLHRLAPSNADVSDIIKELIEAGADISIKNRVGRTPFDLAYTVFTTRFRTGETGEDYKRTANTREILKTIMVTISPKEIQHIIPAIIALTKKHSNVGKNIGSLIAAQLIPGIVNEKLALAHKMLSSVPEDQLRQEIIASINSVITKSPRIQAAEK